MSGNSFSPVAIHLLKSEKFVAKAKKKENLRTRLSGETRVQKWASRVSNSSKRYLGLSDTRHTRSREEPGSQCQLSCKGPEGSGLRVRVLRATRMSPAAKINKSSSQTEAGQKRKKWKKWRLEQRTTRAGDNRIQLSLINLCQLAHKAEVYQLELMGFVQCACIVRSE